MHYFDKEVAQGVGVNAAILYQNIRFWIEKNRANDKNFKEGVFWTYNSRAAFGELFPYLTDGSIKAALKKLVDEGYLIKGEFNKASHDRTSWYSIPLVTDANGLVTDANGLVTDANGLVNSDHSLTDNKQDSKPDKHFNIFWTAYPRNENKKKAKQLFKKKCKSEKDFKLIIDGLNNHIANWKDPKFIPHASTWLNGERWRDETESKIRREIW